MIRRLRQPRALLMAMALVIVWVSRSQQKSVFDLGPSGDPLPFLKIVVLRKKPGDTKTAKLDKIQMGKSGEQVCLKLRLRGPRLGSSHILGLKIRGGRKFEYANYV